MIGSNYALKVEFFMITVTKYGSLLYSLTLLAGLMPFGSLLDELCQAVVLLHSPCGGLPFLFLICVPALKAVDTFAYPKQKKLR